MTTIRRLLLTSSIFCPFVLIAAVSLLPAQIPLPSKRPVAQNGDVWAHSEASISVNSGSYTSSDSDTTYSVNSTSTSLNFGHTDATGSASIYSYTYAQLTPSGTNSANTVHAYASADAYNLAGYTTAPADASALAFGYAAAVFQVQSNPSYPTAGQTTNSATLSCTLYVSLNAYSVNRSLIFSPSPTTIVSAESGDSYVVAYPLDDDGDYWYIYGSLETSTSGSPNASPVSVGDTVPGNDAYFYYGTQATQVGASFVSAASAQYESTVSADSSSDGEDNTSYVAEAIHTVSVP